jgi:hypothetical protein
LVLGGNAPDFASLSQGKVLLLRECPTSTEIRHTPIHSHMRCDVLTAHNAEDHVFCIVKPYRLVRSYGVSDDSTTLICEGKQTPRH